MSLIPLAVTKIKEEIETLHASAVQLWTYQKLFASSLTNTFLRISLKVRKSKAITDIKEIQCAKADCDMNERPSKRARVLSEDEQLVAMLKGSCNAESISGGGGKEGSLTSSPSRAKAIRTTSPSPLDLEIVEYIEYIISNLPSNDPFLVWPRLVLRGL